jgi:hypothetical protein
MRATQNRSVLHRPRFREPFIFRCRACLTLWLADFQYFAIVVALVTGSGASAERSRRIRPLSGAHRMTKPIARDPYIAAEHSTPTFVDKRQVATRSGN